MKKLLSILAAVGMVATASSSVVACGTKTSNNPNYSYKDFEGWVNKSNKDNVNEIIFIGGRTDVDSLSFLAAREEAAGQDPNIADATKMADSKRAAEMDNKFNDYLLKNSAIMDASSTANVALSKDEVAQKESTLVKDFFWDKAGQPSGIELHSVLVDNVETFFNDGLGKDIIDKFVNNQIKDVQKFAYSPDWNDNNYEKEHTTQKEKDASVKKIKDGITSALKNDKGPYFLVISKGKLAGITTGYKNYTEFNSQASKDVDTNRLSKNAVPDIEALFKNFTNNVWDTLYAWLQDNWFPGKNASGKFIVNNKDIKSWSGAVVSSHKTYDPNKTDKPADNADKGTDSKGDKGNNNDNSGSKTDNNSKDNKQKAYAIDLNKYID